MIPQSYSELHGLNILDLGNIDKYKNENSIHKIQRSLFKAIEICLINIVDLTKRSIIDIENDLWDQVLIKKAWELDFHRIISEISKYLNKIQLFYAIYDDSEKYNYLSIKDSSNLNNYFKLLKNYDFLIIKKLTKYKIIKILEESEKKPNIYELIHKIKVCNHEIAVWEKELLGIKINSQINNYENFVESSILREAVYNLNLEGDTYYIQFKAIHQIQEIICYEINEKVKYTITKIEQESLREAIEELENSCDMFTCLISAMIPMINNLKLKDYHLIRENLGLTSGSHSKNLRYNLFGKLYKSLCTTILNKIDENAKLNSYKELDKKLLELYKLRNIDESSWLVFKLVCECIKLRNFINNWRNLHMHFSRNNLGGEGVKSLIGSYDVIKKNISLDDNAKENDPLNILVKDSAENNDKIYSFRNYFNNAESLDRILLSMTGEVTRNNFKDIQSRTGIFSKKKSS